MVLAAVLAEAGKFEIRSFPRPDLGPGDMLVRMVQAGICGTDVEVFRGLLTEFRLPLIMGHEIVGVVDEIGSQAAEVRQLKKGDRVIVEASLSCGECAYCQSGQKRHCKTAGSYGLRTSCEKAPHLWGGYAEAVYVPPGATVYKVPNAMSVQTAGLLTSVIANGLQWVSRVGECRLGDTVVVQGAGPQGLSCCAAAREAGAHRVVISGLGRDIGRLQLAPDFGADVIVNIAEQDLVDEVRRLTGGAMADLVVDVTGSPQSPQVALELVKVGGRIVHASQMGTTVASPLFLDTLVRKEASIYGARSKGSEAVRRAFALAEAGKYPFERMVTHHFRLGELQSAFERFVDGSDRPLKAVVDF